MLNNAYSENIYTANEFICFVGNENEPNVRYELIDGYIYMMSSPSIAHQRLISFISYEFMSYFRGKTCEVFVSPLDVFLYDKRNKKDCINVYQPDLFVVCDKNKLKKNGVYGAPELIVEIVSKSTSHNDYVHKFNNYMLYGVKEYWIVNHDSGQIVVYINMTKEVSIKAYKFNDIVTSDIFDNLCVDFSRSDIVAGK